MHETWQAQRLCEAHGNFARQAAIHSEPVVRTAARQASRSAPLQRHRAESPDDSLPILPCRKGEVVREQEPAARLDPTLRAPVERRIAPAAEAHSVAVSCYEHPSKCVKGSCCKKCRRYNQRDRDALNNIASPRPTQRPTSARDREHHRCGYEPSNQ